MSVPGNRQHSGTKAWARLRTDIILFAQAEKRHGGFSLRAGWSDKAVPAEPDPSLIEWLDAQDTGFMLTYDTVHPSTPEDWFDCPEDVE